MVSKLEQDLLLSHVLKKDRTYLYSNTIKLSKKGQKTYNLFLKRRKKGEPLAYILGKKEFYSLELTVNKNVLIPRPETELIVDVVLDLFKGDACSLLDLGTGSGAISFALAKERPSWKILAIDKSTKCCKIKCHFHFPFSSLFAPPFSYSHVLFVISAFDCSHALLVFF